MENRKNLVLAKIGSVVLKVLKVFLNIYLMAQFLGMVQKKVAL